MTKIKIKLTPNPLMTTLTYSDTGEKLAFAQSLKLIKKKDGTYRARVKSYVQEPAPVEMGDGLPTRKIKLFKTKWLPTGGCTYIYAKTTQDFEAEVDFSEVPNAESLKKIFVSSAVSRYNKKAWNTKEC